MSERCDAGGEPLTVVELTALLARLAVEPSAVESTAEPSPDSSADAAGMPGVESGGHDAAFAAFVAARDAARGGDGERIDRIRALEALKAAVAAAQAREVAAFAASQEQSQRDLGYGDDVGRGVAAQVAMAMRSSHHAALRFTRYARLLTRELPHTLAALSAGETTERRAVLVAQHTAWLCAQDRAVVDARVGPRLEGLGDRQVENTVRKLAGELDPAGLVERQRRAETERRVSTRPAPDTMAYLTALLPAAAAIGCQARLGAVADALTAAGDTRNRAQIMADLLVDAVTGRNRITGIPTHDDLEHVEDLTDLHPDDLHFEPCGDDTADGSQPAGSRPAAQGPADVVVPTTADTDTAQQTAPAAPTGPTARKTPGAPTRPGATPGGFVPLPAGVGVEIKLVMTDLALFGGSDEPAHLEGYGPVPAAWVRDLLTHSDATARFFLRRLFTAPDTGALAGIDSRRREFTGSLRALILARDQFCRAPWCGAPIRHIDHITPHADGGATSLPNAQGLCEACNHAKQAPGWQAEPDPGNPGEVHTTTPTGHRYTSRPPHPPGHQSHPSQSRDDAPAAPPFRPRTSLLGSHFALALALAG